MELIAFLPQRFHVVKLEVTEFDQVLLAEIEDVQDTVGEFWDEVGGRVGNTLRQAVLFLQEEQDFPEFSSIHVVVDALRAQNFITLMNRHFNLAQLRLLGSDEQRHDGDECSGADVAGIQPVRVHLGPRPRPSTPWHLRQ